jgi:superfamily II DNA helicase RecQ
VLGITYVVYLKALYSIIDYTQEARRAGRAKERVTAIIIVKDKD